MFTKGSSGGSAEEKDGVQDIVGNNTYHPGTADGESDELHVRCPPHTTERRIVMRIDWRLVPFLCILYLLAFLDRVNIANARSFHLMEDLGLQGVEYNTVLQGFVQNYGGLLTTRFFLGMWYKRSEAQKRYSLFFSSTSLAGAFGGLLASAIGKMDGIRGYHGWRWIFILEGILTCAVALLFFFVFPSFPEQAKWLNEEERAYVKARLQADTGRNAAERKVSFRDFLTVMKDHRVWLGGFMYFGLIVPAYGYAYFAPTIISTYGYNPIQTQLHSVPPWAASFGFSLLIAALSDATKLRAPFALAPLALSIAGFGILLSVHDKIRIQYAALCFVTMGTYGAMPIIVCWFNMNLGGHHRRSIGTAWQVGFGNIGGIIATYSFVSTDAPRFVKGYAIAISFTILSIIACTVYLISIMVENRKRAKSARDVGLSEYEKTEMGDLNPEFKYMY
ncbi:hypothetical protein DL764_009577 [Monosporascus ibericus]|uniref:Major facilitator superfamily (MFS) profile domain-containing protein n=1 Tax=Monosporascus ibericus TaxID=155417 RepID=A0A4Q4SXH8_9PEZI|nr:hypothetical protein DL764_009577 [Monosporascus ibericus]